MTGSTPSGRSRSVSSPTAAGRFSEFHYRNRNLELISRRPVTLWEWVSCLLGRHDLVAWPVQDSDESIIGTTPYRCCRCGRLARKERWNTSLVSLDKSFLAAHKPEAEDTQPSEAEATS